MAKTYLVIDLEGTCCNDGSIPLDERETIEIGAVEICGGRVVREFQSFVRPVRHTHLTMFCQLLTGITQEQVDEAKLFPVTWSEFRRWCGNMREYYSWGSYDQEQFARDCDYHKIELDLRHMNLARLFQQHVGRKCGHRRAMKHLGLQPSGAHHRGLDDARNIAQILARMVESGAIPA